MLINNKLKLTSLRLNCIQ